MSDIDEQANRAHAVVVGVDGTATSDVAARYACEEAARAGTGVRVVHVVPTYLAMAPMYPLPPEDLLEAGRSVLHGVMTRLRPVAGDVPLEGIVRRGAVVPTLADVGDAREVVVGSDRRSVAARILTGNVSTGVAASAPVPTVSVPETWQPARRHGVVLVGVKHQGHSGELFAEAFAVAQERGDRILVVHAWKMPSGYDDIIASRVAYEEWDASARREVEDMLAPWRTRYPDVAVEVRSVHAQAAHALVEASGEADELVLVRRAHGVPAGTHLGATARSVLMHSQCPVRVVPPGYQRRTIDLTLESQGRLLK